jgi:hypothetical protein
VSSCFIAAASQPIARRRRRCLVGQGAGGRDTNLLNRVPDRLRPRHACSQWNRSHAIEQLFTFPLRRGELDCSTRTSLSVGKWAFRSALDELSRPERRLGGVRAVRASKPPQTFAERVGVCRRGRPDAYFAGGYRSSDLVTLDVEHVRFVDGSVRVFLPRSKEDQLGRGRTTVIPNSTNEHVVSSARAAAPARARRPSQRTTFPRDQRRADPCASHAPVRGHSRRATRHQARRPRVQLLVALAPSRPCHLSRCPRPFATRDPSGTLAGSMRAA